MLLLHDDLHTPGVRCSLVSFVSEIIFLFNFHLDVSDIVYNGNLFDHATLKGALHVLDEIEQLPFFPHFRLYFRHA